MSIDILFQIWLFSLIYTVPTTVNYLFLSLRVGRLMGFEEMAQEDLLFPIFCPGFNLVGFVIVPICLVVWLVEKTIDKNILTRL